MKQQLVSAERVWPYHPKLLVNRAMAGVGAAAGRGEAVPPEVLQLLSHIAKRNPLAPEPFLVAGAIAQTERRDRDAELLFEAAKTRDPRGGAARYFLAGRYLQIARIDDALKEMSALARLVPGAEGQFVPALAAYAKQPGARAPLKRFLADSPRYSLAVLDLLAEDSANADLIVALTGPRRPGETAAAWHSKLVSKLIEKGDVARAQVVWRELAGVAPYDGVYNSRFADVAAPAPFNWTYDTSGAGLVTPRAGGGLDVLYYGRQDSELAQQVLTLPPGRYRFSASMASHTVGDAMEWRLDCIPAKVPLLEVAILRGATTFTVQGGGCAAQRLRLVGVSNELPVQVEVRVNSVQVEKWVGR